jgi:hypothetical protein
MHIGLSSLSLRSGNKTYTNLLMSPDAFDNASWSKGMVAVTADATTAPDGTSSADLIIPNTTSTNVHRVYQSASIAAGTYIVEIYAKPSGYTGLFMHTFDVGRGDVLFELTGAGSIASVTGASGATITALDDGWYHIRYMYSQADATGGVQVHIFPSSASTAAYSGDSTSGIYLWNAGLFAA